MLAKPVLEIFSLLTHVNVESLSRLEHALELLSLLLSPKHHVVIINVVLLVESKLSTE